MRRIAAKRKNASACAALVAEKLAGQMNGRPRTYLAYHLGCVIGCDRDAQVIFLGFCDRNGQPAGAPHLAKTSDLPAKGQSASARSGQRDCVKACRSGWPPNKWGQKLAIRCARSEPNISSDALAGSRVLSQSQHLNRGVTLAKCNIATRRCDNAELQSDLNERETTPVIPTAATGNFRSASAGTLKTSLAHQNSLNKLKGLPANRRVRYKRLARIVGLCLPSSHCEGLERVCVPLIRPLFQ
jgi:hypothetical protein